MNWELGTIQPGNSVTVSLPPTVDETTGAGAIIEFSATVEDSTGVTNTTSETVDVVNGRTLELTVATAGPNPVSPGSQVTYVLTYGYSATSGTASNVVMEFPIPAGLNFVSATGSGALFGAAVRWTFGSLTPGQVGEQRVTFNVDAAAIVGTVIKMEALLQNTGTPAQTVRRDVITRLTSTTPLKLHIEANIDPAEPGEVLGLALTVTNSSAFDRSDVRVRMTYPAGLKSLDDGLIESGDCTSIRDVFRCDTTELLFWNIGLIKAGTGVTVSLPPTVSETATPGSLIEFFAKVIDSTGTNATASETVAVTPGRTLELALTETGLDPVSPGGRLTYRLNFGHSALSGNVSNVLLELPVPAGLSFVSATAKGSLVGNTVRWTLGILRPGQWGERRVTFNVNRAVSVGTAIKAQALLRNGAGPVQRIRSDAVTRVKATTPLKLTVQAITNSRNEPPNVKMQVTNSSTFDRSEVKIVMRYPEGLQSISRSSIEGGECPGANSIGGSTRCAPTKLLIFNLGTIKGTTTRTVSVPLLIDNEHTLGKLIVFKAAVSDSTTARTEATDVIGLGEKALPDSDGDGTPDVRDNCPDRFNASQVDTDADGHGNACDAFPKNSNEFRDSDGDGIGDDYETRHGLNPKDPGDAKFDSDKDGFSNLREFLAGSHPRRKFSRPNDDIRYDFNGDGQSDLFWRNVPAKGRNLVWIMKKNKAAVQTRVNNVGGTAWRIKGFGDFNGDGFHDALWRNTQTGKNVIFQLKSNGKIEKALTINTLSRAWDITGVGDFNRDGKADVLWHNNNTGDNFMYLMDRNTILASRKINKTSNAWKVVGIGDSNGDGYSDIYWRNSVNGVAWLYRMQEHVIKASKQIITVPKTWKVVGLGDFNGDNKVDMLWRNTKTGVNQLFLMNGAKVVSSLRINTVSVKSEWRVASVGDYTGDGKADIIWRNLANGSNVLYQMNSNKISKVFKIASVKSRNWRIQNLAP